MSGDGARAIAAKLTYGAEWRWRECRVRCRDGRARSMILSGKRVQLGLLDAVLVLTPVPATGDRLEVDLRTAAPISNDQVSGDETMATVEVHSPTVALALGAPAAFVSTLILLIGNLTGGTAAANGQPREERVGEAQPVVDTRSAGAARYTLDLYRDQSQWPGRAEARGYTTRSARSSALSLAWVSTSRRRSERSWSGTGQLSAVSERAAHRVRGRMFRDRDELAATDTNSKPGTASR